MRIEEITGHDVTKHASSFVRKPVAKAPVKHDNYDDAMVKKIVDAAAHPLPEKMSGDDLMDHVRRLLARDAAA